MFNGIVVCLAQRRIDVCPIQYRHVTTGMLCDFTTTNVTGVPMG